MTYFLEKCFKPCMKTVCESKYYLGVFRNSLLLNILTALGSSCKAPIFSCNFANDRASYRDRHQMGQHSCPAAWMWKQCALVLEEICHNKFHFTDLTSILLWCCSWAKGQMQATGIPVWVRKQEWRVKHSVPLRRIQPAPEVVSCDVLHVSPHLAKYISAHLPLQPVGHGC